MCYNDFYSDPFYNDMLFAEHVLEYYFFKAMGMSRSDYFK